MGRDLFPIERGLYMAFLRCVLLGFGRLGPRWERRRFMLLVWMLRRMARTLGPERTRAFLLEVSLNSLPPNPHPNQVERTIKAVSPLVYKALGAEQADELYDDLLGSHGLFSSDGEAILWEGRLRE